MCRFAGAVGAAVAAVYFLIEGIQTSVCRMVKYESATRLQRAAHRGYFKRSACRFVMAFIL